MPMPELFSKKMDKIVVGLKDRVKEFSWNGTTARTIHACFIAKYVPGKELSDADALSRVPVSKQLPVR